MIKISYNKYRWIGSIIAGIIFTLLFSFFIYGLFIFKFNDTASLFIAPLVILLIGFASTIFWLQILHLPFEVFINESEKIIIIKFLLTGTRNINIDDIESYSSNIVITRRARFNGIMIQLKNKRLIQCGDFNLKDHIPISLFLENSKIPFLGKGQYKFRHYIKNCLK